MMLRRLLQSLVGHRIDQQVLALFYDRLDALAAEAEVQQPKITLTFSSSINRWASWANVGQSDRPSATTHSISRPRKPALVDLV